MINFKNTFTKSAVCCVSALLIASIASCQFKGVRGSGNVTTESRTVSGNFKGIEAENGLEVEIEQSATTSISVVADDNLQSHIKVRVADGILKISCDVNNFIDVESKKVIVKTPVIESIQATSGTSLKTMNTVKCNSMMLKSSSGSTMNVAIETERAACESSSGSTIKVSGKAITLEVGSSSGSNIDAEKLLSNEVIASASSGSSIDVYPLVSLTAESSSGASIGYHNVPKSINKKSNSGGSIDKQ